MNLVVNLLKSELKAWRGVLVDERAYYKGAYDDPMAVASLKEINENITQLKRAIEILTKNK
jgi:hypothetical protein